MKIIIALFALFLTACTSMQPIELSQNDSINRHRLINNIDVGDDVLIKTLDEKIYEFEVYHISEDRIAGGGINLDIQQIKEIEKAEFSFWKTYLYTALAAIPLGAITTCACEPPLAGLY